MQSCYLLAHSAVFPVVIFPVVILAFLVLARLPAPLRLVFWLMAAAVEYLRADGTTNANIWVPVGNEPRRAFLHGCGWGPDSALRDIEADGVVIREVRLATVLD